MSISRNDWLALTLVAVSLLGSFLLIYAVALGWIP